MAMSYVEKALNCPTYKMRYAEVLAASFTSGVIVVHWRQLRQEDNTPIIPEVQGPSMTWTRNLLAVSILDSLILYP